MLLDKLPTKKNQGKYRFTTDNYDTNINAIDVGGFSSSMLWNYSTSAFGDCVYAIPMAYCGSANDKFYMEYQGTYTADNTQAYLNRITSSSLTGVYKFSVKGALKVDTYNTIKLVSGQKQKELKNNWKITRITKQAYS